LRLISMVVRVGGHAVLDLADSPEQIPQPRRGRRAQPLDPQRLVDEMTVAGLRVLDVSSLSESSLVDGRHGDTPGTRTVMTCTR
jgi:hypothetical protein